MSHHRKGSNEIPRTNIPLAKDSLETARSDLKSAKALYDSGCYPNSIYHLQQSIEKSWKSFGFFYGIITEGQARSRDIVGHKGSKVCTKTISSFKKVVGHMRVKIKAVKNICETEPSDSIPPMLSDDNLKKLDDGVDTLLREIHNFTANENQIRNMPFDDMKQIVDHLTELQYSLGEAEKELNESLITNELCEKIRMGTYRLWRPLVAGNPFAEGILKKTVFVDLTDDMIREIMNATFHGMAVTVPLFHLAVITQVHEQTTRYRMDGISPESLYTSNHPMIRLFPQIYSLAENTLANLEQLYMELPSAEEEIS